MWIFFSVLSVFTPLHLVFSDQLDDISLHGMTNQEVLEVMKQTGQTVVLTLVRKKAKGLERSLDKGREMNRR